MRWGHAILLLAAGLMGWAGPIRAADAQTTQPSSNATAQSPAPIKVTWNDVVEQFAQGLCADSGAGAPRGLMVDRPSVRAFGSITPSDDPAKLAREVVGATVIGTHAYTTLPAVLASDISSDFSRAADIPDKIKSKMMPDDATMPRANATSRQWLRAVLDAAAPTASGNASQNPDAPEPIGVIILWRPHNSLDRLPAILKDGPGDVMFVIVRGVEGHDMTKIKQILYGDPMASVN